jgi:hypothetical protein
MDFFVSTAQAPHSYRVLRTKEELFEELSKRIDENVSKDCTYFDLIINSDPKDNEEE